MLKRIILFFAISSIFTFKYTYARSSQNDLWQIIQSDTFPYQLQYSQEKITAQKMLEELSSSISQATDDYFQSLKTVIIYQSLAGNIKTTDSLIHAYSEINPQKINELIAVKLFISWLPCIQSYEGEQCVEKKNTLQKFLKENFITSEHNEAMKWYWIGQMLSDTISIDHSNKDFIYSPQLDEKDNPPAFNGAVLAISRNPNAINILISNGYREPVRLFEINKKGIWTDITQTAQLDSIPGGHRMYSTDINNDGYQDILILRNLPSGRPAYLYPSLLINQKDGTYKDISHEAGFNIPQRSDCACFLDANNDGRLDIFLGGEGLPSLLFIQKDSNKFEESAGAYGIVTRPHKVVDCATYDINNDGNNDLLLSTYNYTNIVYEYQIINQQYPFFVNQSQRYDFHLPYKGNNFITGDFDGDQEIEIVSNTDHSYNDKDVIFNILSGKYQPDESPRMWNMDTLAPASTQDLSPVLTYSRAAVNIDKGNSRPHILSGGGRNWDEWYPISFYQFENDSDKHSLISLKNQPNYINSMTVTPLPNTGQPVIWVKGGYPNTLLKNKVSSYVQAYDGGKFISIHLTGKDRKDALGSKITVTIKNKNGAEVKRTRYIQAIDSRGNGAGQNIWYIPANSSIKSILVKWFNGKEQIIHNTFVKKPLVEIIEE